MIVTTAERPDLAETSARWRWDEFFQGGTRPWNDVLAAARHTATLADAAMPKTFILLEDGVPAGTASLVARDLEERPDLTPWLAGVVVAPDKRGRGYAVPLIRAVEQAAAEAGQTELWLYTWTAEGLYARIGWNRSETLEHNGRPVVVMRRVLDRPAAPAVERGR